MALHRFSPPENNVPDTSNLKDSAFTTVVAGYLLPGCIVLIVVWNLITGYVYWPAHRLSGDTLDGMVQSFGYGWHFAGIVTLKLGVAAAMFSWYGLANHDRTEYFAQPAMVLSIAIACLGLATHAIAFFM